MNPDTQRVLNIAARVLSLCLCLLLSLTCSTTLVAAQTGQPPLEILWRVGPDKHEWPILVDESQKANVGKFIERWGRVASALEATPTHGLAGGYAAETGEVGGTSLQIHPEAGYVLANIYTCSPKVRKLSFGSVRLTSEGAELFPEVYLTENTRTGVLEPLAGPARIKLVAGRWGDYQLLVPVSGLDDFLDYAAGRGKHNSEFMTASLWGLSVFSRSKSEQAQQYGPPEFPRPYAGRVRPPAEGRIIWSGPPQRVGGVNNSSLRYHVPVRVELDSPSGVRRGTVFWVRGTADYPDNSLQLTVTKMVRGGVAGSVEVWREGDIGLIREGLRVSTSRYPWKGVARHVH